jgi:hypothetical protein
MPGKVVNLYPGILQFIELMRFDRLRDAHLLTRLDEDLRYSFAAIFSP